MRARRTLELRWFVTGHCPPEVRERFGRCPVGPVEQRTDRYLMTSADLGLKRRNGESFDVKIRRAATDWASGDRAGRVEDWEGWTFSGVDRSDLPGDPWVRIVKRRSRRFRPLDDPGAITSEPAGGASIELVDVEAPWGPAWSVCVEVPGVDPATFDAVMRAEADLLPEPASLATAMSGGYPEWVLAHSAIDLRDLSGNDELELVPE